MITLQSTAERFNNLYRLHVWQQYNLLSNGLAICKGYIYDINIIYCRKVSQLCIRYVHANSTTGNHWHHNAQTFIGSAHNNKTGKTSGKILLRANKPMIILREINLSFFSFNLLHYLESVILNTTTMTTIQSTVKRVDSEQYNDIAIII
jgi:hypothetical protein